MERALSLGGGGPYVLQAAIAELHLGEPRDWEQIAALYSALQGLMGSPVVELNRAVAVAEVEGPAAALALLEGLPLEDYRYFHSTRADLLRRAGRDEEAQRAYERALELSQTEPERRFLEGRIAALRPPSERVRADGLRPDQPLGASVRVNSTARRVHASTWRLVRAPSSATWIQPAIGRPRISICFV